jgi:hypothetical protein
MTRNTDKTSTEKIWVRCIEDLVILDFSGKLSAVIQHIKNLESLHGTDAVINIVDDYDGYTSASIEYWRLETDQEYKTRLKKIAGYKDAAIKRAAKKAECDKQKEAAERKLYEQLKAKYAR